MQLEYNQVSKEVEKLNRSKKKRLPIENAGV